MLIIEGSDCVGKTTLCNELIKRLCDRDLAVIPQHFGLLPKGWDYYDDYLPFMNSRTVMDRFIMSEVVYGHIIRGHSELTPELYRRLDAHLRLQGSVTVVVVATDVWLEEQLRDKYAGRREVFSESQIRMVNHGFRELVDDANFDDEACLWVQDYNVDCDFVYQVNDRTGMPSSDNHFVDSVVLKYIERQEVVKWKGTH